MLKVFYFVNKGEYPLLYSSNCIKAGSAIRPGKRVVRFGFGSGKLWVKSIRVGYGFGSGEVWVRIYFGSIMFGLGMGSVRLKSGSGLFGWCYGNPVWIGYGLGLLWVG